MLVDLQLVSNPPNGEFEVRAFPFTERAIALGNKRVANMIALGTLIGAGDVAQYEALKEAVRVGVPAKFLDLNLEAIECGFAMSRE